MVRFDLPWDLVDEILSRVPATSLRRLQYTCKRWNALFKDPEFITKQLDKAVKQNLVLMWSNFRVYSLRINLNEIQNDIEISQLFHCNGLLLCSTKEANKTKLVVVNPCTGQTRWIEPRSDYTKHDIYALGYENNNKKSYDSYKILRISYGGKLL
ncbi:F-box-like domain superfamily, partial [Arabidopsis suecica]